MGGDLEARMRSSQWLGTKRAAAVAGVSASTLRRWADAGKVPCRQTSRGREFALRDLDELRRSAETDKHGRGRRSVETAPHVGPPQAGQSELQCLVEASLEFGGTLDIDEVLPAIARHLRQVAGAASCNICSWQNGVPQGVVSVDGDVIDEAYRGTIWPTYTYDFGRGKEPMAEPLEVCDVETDERLSEGERRAWLAGGFRSGLVLPFKAGGEFVGGAILFGREPRRFEHLDLLQGLAQLAARAIANARLHDEVSRLHLGNLRALTTALNAKDGYTLGHAGRVAAYTVLLGRELGWSDDYLVEVQDAAYLHDIGKIAISDRVLLKPGPLNSEEWELMRQHPAISTEIVGPLFGPQSVAGVRHHHERFDGGGYPDGLVGKAIPEMARALCVADCYDAMSSNRPYRGRLTYRQCLAELRSCRDTQFDPEIVGVFLRVLDRLKRRRRRVDAIARQAATLVDAHKHALLRTPADATRPEYAEMVGALRALRDANPPTRFITSFALVDGQCVTVLDTGDGEQEKSRVGDPWFADDGPATVLAGETIGGNVLTSDDYGTWVTCLSPVCDANGAVAAVVGVDVPALESVTLQQFHSDLSPGLASMLQATAVRSSRAELEATTDALTGLYSHSYFQERLAKALTRARHEETKLSLLLCGLDEFKRYNETCGYRAGDEALCRVARIIEGCSREADRAARYGGEEFAVVLMGADAHGAAEVAERIRAEVAATHAAYGEPLTVSIGVATFPDGARTKDALLEKAARAMHAAKSGGRNRVVVFSGALVRSNAVHAD
jgi:diguanylate cyclase (GGDEF)-like protein